MNEQGLKFNTAEDSISPETAIELSKKVSLLITKPENTDTEVPLLLLLKNRHFNAKTYRKVLDENTLANLYPDMPNWPELVQKATKDHMLDKEVEVFLITYDGENPQIEDFDVLNELIKLRGEKTKADANPSGTLRREFHGEDRVYRNDVDGSEIKYSQNGFHCPRNPEELIGNLNALGLMEDAIELAK